MKGRRHEAQPHLHANPAFHILWIQPFDLIGPIKEDGVRNVLAITPLVVKDYPISHHSNCPGYQHSYGQGVKDYLLPIRHSC